MQRIFSRIAQRSIQATSVRAVAITQPVRINATSFAIRSFSQATEKAEPFLDPKMVTDRVMDVVKNYEKVTKPITGTSRFKEDLDLDSLDAVEVVMAIEEEFCIEIPDSEADKILSISDAVQYISTHPMAK